MISTKSVDLPILISGKSFSLLMTLVVLVTSSFSALAQDSTWDNGSANSIWDTTSSNWSGSTWINGRGAIFGALGAGTINVSGPISINSLSFVENGYSINGSGPLTFVNGTSTQTTGVVNVGTGVTATLNVPLISSVGFQKIGQGVLELGGSGNSFTGQVPLTAAGNVTAGFMIGKIGALPTTEPLSGTVKLLSASAMPAFTKVGISNGYLDIGSNNVTISSLTFTSQNQPRAWDAVRNANNGVIGSGTLRVTGDIHVLGQTGGNSGNSIAANLDLGGGIQIVRVGVISSFALNNALMFTGSLSNGSLVKTIGYGASGSMGSVDGISLFGNNTYTGASIFNGGTNVATGTNDSQSIVMAGVAAAGNSSSITLQGANGSFGAATTIDAVGGGRFIIDNNVTQGASGNNSPTIAAAQNNDRIRDDVAITLRDGSFVYRGLTATAASENYGNLNVTGGHNVVTVAPNGGTSTISGTDLTLAPRSTLAIGTAGAAGTAVLGTHAKVLFSGTVPAADGTGIIRGIVTGTSTAAISLAPTATDFVTYDAVDGFKTLTSYASDFSTAGTNVSLAASNVTPISTISINALKTSATLTTNIGAANTLTIDSGMLLSAAGTNTISNGTLNFGNNPGLIFGSHTINSAITGTQGLVHSTGNLTLAGNLSGLSGVLTSSVGISNTTSLNTNTFSGPIEVRGGTLSIGVNQTGSGLGAITLGVPQNSDNLFSLIPTLSFTATTVTQIDRDIIVDNGGTDLYGLAPSDSLIARLQPTTASATGPVQTLSGDITLNSDLALYGQGVTATSTSATRFTGDITGTGRFLIRNGRAIFDVGSTWSNSGGFQIGAVGNVVQASFFGIGTGSGNISVTGSTTGVMGLMRYNNNNSFGSGSITVLNGATTGLTFEPTATTVISNQINLNNGASATFINTGTGIDAEWAGQLTGSGVITKNGTGKWILSNSTNTNSGIITVSAGVLQVGNGGSTGSLGTSAIVNNSSLVFNRNNNFSAANVISGAGLVAKMGAGKLTLTANNSYSGTTTVTQGTLIVDGIHTNGSTYTVNSGAGLGGNGQISNSNVNILSGGVLTPGDEVGKLRIDQSLNLAGIYEWQIISAQVADVVAVGTDLTISGSLSINFLADVDVERFDKFTLFAYQGAFNGAFANSLKGWSINYADKLPGVNSINQPGSWRFVTLTATESRQRLRLMSEDYRIDRFTAVPEPSCLSLGMFSLLLLAGKRSRRGRHEGASFQEGGLAKNLTRTVLHRSEAIG